MLRCVLFSLLFLLPTIAFAQQEEPMLRRGSGDWAPYPNEGCIGGSTCADRRLRVELEDRPVIAVRFRAHDQIGERAGGVLRVKIDGNTIESHLDIPREGRTFTVDVDELMGRYLVFEPARNDEVHISNIEVLYGSGNFRRLPRDPYRDRDDRGRDRWRSYPSAAGCIGGDECRKNGTRITVPLEDLPVIGVRFYANDGIGQRAEGTLSVRIDNTTIAHLIDVHRNGKRHEIEVENVRGSRLVIETGKDDEVEIKHVEVMYGRERRSERRQREATHEGGCIGGDECGGNRARIRVPLYGRAVASVRFYARDDVGTRAGGELRIRIDDEILRDYLDIPREGRTFTIEGNGLGGDYLIIEPAEYDEVVVRDVRVTFAVE